MRPRSSYYYNATSLWCLIKWMVSLLCVRWGCYNISSRRRDDEERAPPAQQSGADQRCDREGLATLITGVSDLYFDFSFLGEKKHWFHGFLL